MFVSESSVEISLDYRYELIGCLALRWERLLAFDQNVKSQVALDQFRHQSIQRTATRGDELQDFLALTLTGERPLDGLDLAFDTPNAREHLYFVFRRV
jgi:hypothetical protein